MNSVIYIILFSVLLVLVLVGVWFMIYFKDNDLKNKLAILVESNDKNEIIPKEVNIFKYLKMLKSSVDFGMNVYIHLHLENNETSVERLEVNIENDGGNFIVKKLSSYFTTMPSNPTLSDVIEILNKRILSVGEYEELTISINIEKDGIDVSSRKFCIAGGKFNSERSMLRSSLDIEG